jgi:hypothetical protein
MTDGADSSIRDLVIMVAANPTVQTQTNFVRALPAATLFVKMAMRGGGQPAAEKFVAEAGDTVMRSARLPNGMEMAHSFAVPPRLLQPGEFVATMTGRQLLEMVLKTSLSGLLVAAGDERGSWGAVTRAEIPSVLGTEAR